MPTEEELRLEKENTRLRAVILDVYARLHQWARQGMKADREDLFEAYRILRSTVAPNGILRIPDTLSDEDVEELRSRFLVANLTTSSIQVVLGDEEPLIVTPPLPSWVEVLVHMDDGRVVTYKVQRDSA